MTLALLYPWLKALHVASALIFTGGVIGVSMFLAAVRADPSNAPVAQHIRRWDQAVTTPAMLLVWSFGLIMAINGGWLADGWLQAKLVLVVLLSAVHGVQSGKLRRLSAGGFASPAAAHSRLHRRDRHPSHHEAILRLAGIKCHHRSRELARPRGAAVPTPPLTSGSSGLLAE